MHSVKGTYKGGIVKPAESVEGREGQSVLITFLDNDEASEESYDVEWHSLRQLLESCQMNTGIPDLAHEHDHYIHSKPKRGQ